MFTNFSFPGFLGNTDVFERERACAPWGGAGEKERETSRALCTEGRARCRALSHDAEVMTSAGIESQLPHRLRHPGASFTEFLTPFLSLIFGMFALSHPPKVIQPMMFLCSRITTFLQISVYTIVGALGGSGS